jgi:hypothetical protein
MSDDRPRAPTYGPPITIPVDGEGIAWGGWCWWLAGAGRRLTEDEVRGGSRSRLGVVFGGTPIVFHMRADSPDRKGGGGRPCRMRTGSEQRTGPWWIAS